MEPFLIRALLFVLLGGLALILFGAALLGVVRVVSAPPQLSRRDPAQWVLVIVGRVLIASGVAAGALFVCFLLAGPGLGLVVLAMGSFVVGMAFLRHRRAQQYTLLSTLAVAAERLMPLAPAVAAFADERWGLMGLRARRLASLLEAGLTLPDALDRTPGLVSRQDQATIRVGQESGALAESLSDVVRSHQLHAPLWNQTMGRVLYLWGLILFACPIVAFMMTRIAPEFRTIFEEFDAELPPITRVMIGAAAAFAHWGILTVPILLFLVVGFVLVGIQYMAGVRWNLPLVSRLTRRLDTAVILEALALAAERDVAFPAGIETLARWYPRRSIRRRLEAVLQDLKAGADWSISLARQGLIRQVELAVFQAAGRAGNLAWALREMADSSRRRLNYRLYTLIQVLFPLAVVAFGLMVMAYVISFFLPLIALVANLT